MAYRVTVTDKFGESYTRYGSPELAESVAKAMRFENPEAKVVVDKEDVPSNSLALDFGNIVSELESKNLSLFWLHYPDRGLFVEDEEKNVYRMETYFSSPDGCLEPLIKNKRVVYFEFTDEEYTKNIPDWQKEDWGASDVKAYIDGQSRFWYPKEREDNGPLDAVIETCEKVSENSVPRSEKGSVDKEGR